MSEHEPDSTTARPKLVALLYQLVDAALELLLERLGLVEDEVRIELQRLRGLALGVAVAAAAMLVGFQLLNAAMVVILVQVGMPLWAAFLLFGALYLVGGALFLRMSLLRAAARGRFLDASRFELERDREWIASRKP